MSNALLLRLFTSEYFNAWIAISYIFKYPDNVGIQHYLCNQLKKFPIAEIEFFLPQLMHLLITRPTESVALECYIIDACEKSTHIAVMSLWYLQAYLSDLSAQPNSPSFQLCKRILNRCQAIIFQEDSRLHDGDEHDLQYMEQIEQAQRVRENCIPAFVGMAAMLAGIGQPLFTKPVGSVAIAQGRKPRNFSIVSSTDASIMSRRNSIDKQDRFYSASQPQLPIHQQQQQRPQTSPKQQKQKQPKRSSSSRPLSSSSSRSSIASSFLEEHRFSVSVEDLHQGKAFSVTKYLKETQQKIQQSVRSTFQNNAGGPASAGTDGVRHAEFILGPSNSSSSSRSSGSNNDYLTIKRKPKMKKGRSNHVKAMAESSVPVLTPDEAFGQISGDEEEEDDSENNDDIIRHSYGSRRRWQGAATNTSSDEDDEVNALKKLSLDDRRHLLRSNYFRSEMQFLLALVDIASRLVIVPKAARLSALHAELTLLNHNLPAEICMPLWCPATVERPYHHRIVRISPTDAVVLNSAERAPYLLLIEVLDDELSLEEGMKSSLSKLKKQKKRQSQQTPKKKFQSIEESGSDIVDLADLGSPTSMRSFDNASPSLSTTTHTSIAVGGGAWEIAAAPESNLTAMNRDNMDVGYDPDEFAEKMKTAAILLAQLQRGNHPTPVQPEGKNIINSPAIRANAESIRQKIITEMMALEDERMEKMVIEGVDKGVGGGSGEGAGNNKKLDDEQRVAMVVNKEDPSAAVFSEDWETKKERIRASSPYGHLPNWRLISVIVKNGADLRQEQFAIQLIREMQKIWQDTKVNVWVQYNRILVTSDDSGLVETIKNSISIHSIKKEAYTRNWNDKGAVFSLKDYYVRRWGHPDTERYKAAQDAFMRSLAGYSVASYIMQIKDRHNGNLLVDDHGHIIHIDFGFILSNSPGSVGFEMAPFKLPQEYIDILGGVNSEKFAEYKALTKEAYLALRKHCDNLLLLVDMMSKDSKLPCFQHGGAHTLTALRDRFQLQLTEPQAEAFVDKLIMSSCCNVFTRLYDTFQYYSQGIL